MLHHREAQKLTNLMEAKTVAVLANHSFIAWTILVHCDFNDRRVSIHIATVNNNCSLFEHFYIFSLQKQYYWPSNQPPILWLSQHRALRENVGRSTAIIMLLLVTVHLIHPAWLSLPKICLLPLCQNLPCHPLTQLSNWTRCGI